MTSYHPGQGNTGRTIITRRALALLIATLLIAAPAAAEDATSSTEATDVVITSSLCCLTNDGSGPDTLIYSAFNSGDTTVTGIEVEITLPPGTVGDPAIDVWVIDELPPGASADLVIALSPDVEVLGTTIEAPAAVRTAVITDPGPTTPAMLPAWLHIA
ncbi:MAG: hypothetical protein KJO84_02390 [Acidimicrobiia bacterium]|nr:hypothetical protein [Acidimicrobiia bacterium]